MICYTSKPSIGNRFAETIDFCHPSPGSSQDHSPTDVAYCEFLVDFTSLSMTAAGLLPVDS